METIKQNKALWIGVAVLALVFSTGFGALAGGAAGYWLGRRSVKPIQVETGVTLPRIKEILPETEETEPEEQGPGWNMPFGRAGGAYVSSVVEGSPADNAGIEVGDVITAIDGQEVSADVDPKAIVQKHRPGDTVEITLQSGAFPRTQRTERTVRVKLGEHPEQKGVAYLGITYTVIPHMSLPNSD